MGIYFEQAQSTFGSLRGFSGASDDQAAYDAAKAAIARAQLYPDAFAGYGVSWSELSNLINQLASIDAGTSHLSDNGGWASTVAEEVRQRTQRVLRYLPVNDAGITPPYVAPVPTPVVITDPPVVVGPPATGVVAPAPTPTPITVIQTPTGTVISHDPLPPLVSGAPGTITLPLIGTISTTTALLGAAALAAVFLFSEK